MLSSLTTIQEAAGLELATTRPQQPVPWDQWLPVVLSYPLPVTTKTIIFGRFLVQSATEKLQTTYQKCWFW